MSKEVETHAMTTGGFSPYHQGHHLVVKKMIDDGHKSVNVFATQSGRRPISPEKKVDYIKTAVGKGVNVGTTQTPFHAAAQLHKEGKRGKLVVYGGSDRAEIADRLRSYNGKEGKHGYYKFEGGIEFRQVGGERKEGVKGMAGVSGTAARKSKNPEELKKFLPTELHPRAKEIFKDLQEETMSPIGIFLLGGPGSGKDYVLKNIFSRFDLTEVQSDQLLNGNAAELYENGKNIVINGVLDPEKIHQIQEVLEGYNFDYVYVSVTNRVSRERNAAREVPLHEQKRLEKWYKVDKLAKSYDCFTFNNSINLQESSEFEKVFFGSQIERLLERITNLGLSIKDQSEPKTFFVSEELKRVRRIPRSGNIVRVKARQKENLATADATQKAMNMIATTAMQKEETKIPAKYRTGNPRTDKARAAHWRKMSKYSDRDPRAYKDAPGDKEAREEGIPLSKHTVAVRKMMAKEEVVVEGSSDKSLAAKAAKSGVSLSTLRTVYRRGVAAWNSGHRPGTTPSQWGHARVNSYINKGKTYHTADKDLRKESADYFEFRRNQDVQKAHRKEVIANAKTGINGDANTLQERQLEGTDEYRKHAIAMTPGQNQEIDDAFKIIKKPILRKEETDELGDCCNQSESNRERDTISFRSLRIRISEAGEGETQIDTSPKIETDPDKVKRKIRNTKKGPKEFNSTLDGLAVTYRGAFAEGLDSVTIEEAVKYHIENQISFTENAFRPGSEMFFEMISEAKKLHKEGKYTPADEFELDMLNSNIGEKVMFEGKEVILDYPFEEELNEEDKTDGKGIGKPWREGGGGAVYVRTGDGGVKKVRFSQSGMKKKFMDPAATRSFVARHRCLTNKDKTSASYWACRYPRFFSNSGKVWW